MRMMISKVWDQDPNRVISKDKILAEFALEFDATRNTGLEILNNYKTVGSIKIKGDTITKEKKFT